MPRGALENCPKGRVRPDPVGCDGAGKRRSKTNCRVRSRDGGDRHSTIIPGFCAVGVSEIRATQSILKRGYNVNIRQRGRR